MTNNQREPLHVLPARSSNRPVLEQLWTMFRHDMSAYSGVLPNTKGQFRQERLDRGLDDPSWSAYLLQLDHSPVGLAVVRGLDLPERIMSSFFLVNGARRAGYGRAAVRAITQANPGKWSVAFQEANTAAASFWAAVAAEADPGWTLEPRAVPNRPELPADLWASFTVPPRVQ